MTALAAPTGAPEAGVAVAGVGVVATAHGAVTEVAGATRILAAATNLLKAATGSGSSAPNKVQSDPKAQGPYSVSKKDANGKITGYTTYDAKGNAVKRYRADGKPHGGVPPPMMHEAKPGKGAGSPLNRARPATPDEIPQ